MKKLTDEQIALEAADEIASHLILPRNDFIKGIMLPIILSAITKATEQGNFARVQELAQQLSELREAIMGGTGAIATHEQLLEKVVTERQRCEQAEQAANHNADIGDSIARASKQVEESLRQQLLSALAAMKEIQDWVLWSKEPLLRDEDKRAAKVAAIIDDATNGLSLLHQHGAEVRKPLVEALTEIGEDVIRQGDAIWMRDKARDALAQCKEKK